MSSGGIQNKYSAGRQTSLGTAFTAIELGADATLGGQAIAAQCYLDKIFFTWKSISTAANFTWYLAYDSGGEFPITDPQEAVTFKTGKTGTTKVNAADLAGAAYVSTNQGTSIHLIAKVDAGSCTAEVVLVWRGR
jgi:hypothetical protein|tara:strand:+ start:1193 stop:1597 length:405 start_codon:yes stop_codon:yes gene_type:complete